MMNLAHAAALVAIVPCRWRSLPKPPQCRPQAIWIGDSKAMSAACNGEVMPGSKAQPAADVTGAKGASAEKG